MKRGSLKALLAIGCACVIALWLVTSSSRAAQPLPDLGTCLHKLDPQVDIGYERIAARCPELMRELEKGPWAAWLPRGWKEPGNDLSAGSLTELRELIGREAAAQTGTRAPQVGRLKGILGGMDVSSSGSGWWARFKAWLRSILESPEQPTPESWFSRMVSRVGSSQSVIELSVYSALAAVVGLAGFIVVNEMRAAGLLGRRVASLRVARGKANVRPSQGGWAEIESAPLTERPRLLLETILKRLSEQGYLPPPAALTVRELTEAVRLPDRNDRARLADLAAVTERVRYSEHEIARAGLEEPVARGRELLERLDAGVSR
jgi:Domain of unknown function (DUF4129)